MMHKSDKVAGYVCAVCAAALFILGMIILYTGGQKSVMISTHVEKFDMSRGYGPFFGKCHIDEPYAYCAVRDK